jgi:geranylgeranyl pyrophosphate synthase
MRAAQAQLASPRTTSLEAYFKHIIAKAGILVAAVAYAGARTHTDNAEVLQGMHNFGLNLGILMQLNDDLRDLSTSSIVNDLHAGYYSLPVLQALTQTEHPHQVRLQHLLADESLTTEEVTEIVNILVDMGSFSFANAMARVYRQKALQCLDSFPAENVVYLKDFLECFHEIDTKSA